ncbi:MAG TPA: HlyD family efflux transporter periplasmic adaptor subunit [Terracidiphilus sp.]
MNNETAIPEGSAKASTDSQARIARWCRFARISGPCATVAATVLFATQFSACRPSTQRSQHLGSQAAGQTHDSTVRLTGKTEAVESRAILAPVISGQQVGTLTIVKLIPNGSRVKQGEILAEFDRAAQVRDVIDKKAQADDQNGKVLEAMAAEDAAKAKDETEIEQAQTALTKAELEMQKVELLSRIDAEKAREDLDEGRATLAQLKEAFDLKRQAAKASIRILEIQRDRTRETMLHSQNNAELMQIRSPIDGVVVFNTIWKEGNMGEVQEGDQVRAGVPFMQVVNPSSMQVHVSVNQQDLFALQVGQKASIHLDAYPDLVLPGRLESIDPMGKHGDFSSKLRIFSATFSIDGSDSRLMPDLSAAVDVHGSLGADSRGEGQ